MLLGLVEELEVAAHHESPLDVGLWFLEDARDAVEAAELGQGVLDVLVGDPKVRGCAYLMMVSMKVLCVQ